MENQQAEELIATLYARIGKMLIDLEALLEDRKRLLRQIEELQKPQGSDGE